jgi:hypothetical protein
MINGSSKITPLAIILVEPCGEPREAGVTRWTQAFTGC